MVSGQGGEDTVSQIRYPSPPLFNPSLALLVDVDNTSAELFPAIMKQVEIWGTVTLRRAYGNQEALFGHKWKELCLLYALQPMAHLGVSGVKNATDIALAVDAIDLFHTQSIKSFCFITGDQDFTALVLRLRSYGCLVYCIGKPSKSEALSRVCTVFIPVASPKTTMAPEQPLAEHQPDTSPVDAALTSLLIQTMETIMTEKKLEWVPVPQLGSHLKQVDRTYTAKTYGYKSTRALCQALNELFECRPNGNHHEVRLKRTGETPNDIP